MRCVVFFSGGVMSWAAAKKAVSKYGAENTTLLFTDTLVEDPDLYRFLEEAAANVGAPLVKIAEGRTPWQVFNDVKMIGNSMKDPCSKILKREIGLKWLQENCDPENTVLVFGIHWEEMHRLEGLKKSKKTGKMVRTGVRPRYEALGFPHVEAPMCEKPWMTDAAIKSWCRMEGMNLPRLYDLGFSHNNCGGFCIKAGEGHFVNLLTKLPAVFQVNEDEEEAFNDRRPGRKRQTVLAPQVRNPDTNELKRQPISLRDFREKFMREGVKNMDLFDDGGCGCFLDDAEADG